MVFNRISVERVHPIWPTRHRRSDADGQAYGNVRRVRDRQRRLPHRHRCRQGCRRRSRNLVRRIFHTRRWLGRCRRQCRSCGRCRPADIALACCPLALHGGSRRLRALRHVVRRGCRNGMEGLCLYIWRCRKSMRPEFRHHCCLGGRVCAKRQKHAVNVRRFRFARRIAD